MDKITTCQDCSKELTYKTKKPNLCKECHEIKFGSRNFYKKPKAIPTKSKGEFFLNKILNEMFPEVSSIDGGYYSFLPSPKGYPMQLDRYYPRLHLAFEFNGKQHEADSEFFYGKEEEFKYQQECDELKAKLCKDNHIMVINVNYNELITKELIIGKLMIAKMYDFVLSKTQIIS